MVDFLVVRPATCKMVFQDKGKWDRVSHEKVSYGFWKMRSDLAPFLSSKQFSRR